ncbi:helix-turn-helix domain-containing protein [Verminephrobacter eiseniae]|uniref:helix-turn-helix domain-containing protein n=1 Tax=Verminephrobacter eiseniae TaxID=364317 RepID=UPI0022388A23|nr:helix-turn-helix domain-containing protein [Verminephrobacter eiseniae]MCW5235309.1 hypothetical protein [Verminephrobacter eiseniae]
MQRLQAFKYQPPPNGGQVRKMRCFAGSCRFVCNEARRCRKRPATRRWQNA